MQYDREEYTRDMKTPLAHSVVVVTGGASGIGKEIVNQLVRKNARVIIVGRTRKTGHSFQKELKKQGFNVDFEHVDMTHQKDVEKMIDRIVKKYGMIDYFYNNAGIFMGGEIRDTKIEHWHEVAHNNIDATMNGTHYAYQQMIKQGFGHIVNVASAAGLFPVPAMGIYGSTKFMIVGLTHTLRNEAKAFGVNVSVVCPTIVNTPLYDTAIYNKVDAGKALKTRGTLQTAEVAAKKIIRGVRRNRAVIHTSFVTHATWLLYRIVPGIYNLAARRILKVYRKKLRA